MSVGRILLSVLQGERVTIQQMDTDVSVNEASNWTLRAGSVLVGLIPPGEIGGGGIKVPKNIHTIYAAIIKVFLIYILTVNIYLHVLGIEKDRNEAVLGCRFRQVLEITFAVY